jgi:hypothetical protein
MALALSAVLALFCTQAYADRIFYDSFETPENATGATDPDGWDQGGGHPSYRRAANEAGQNWSTPYGEQGMSTYSNGIGLKSVTFLPGESGVYSVKFNITSADSKAEYRAELWVKDWVYGPTLLGYAVGDTDGSKDMSFTDEITWRFDYVNGASYDGAELQIRLMQDPLRSNWRSSPIWDNVSVDFVPDIDSAGPTLVDITDDNQGGEVVATGSTVTYTVTFNEPMDAATVETSDFGNGSSSDVTIVSVTPTADPAVFVVAVMPTTEGTLRLSIVEGQTLTDTVGNAMNTYFGVLEDTTTFIVEAGTPILLPVDIVDDRGGSFAPENTLVTYTLTFSKDMNASTVTSADFNNFGTSPITIGTIAEPTPGVFTVQVTPTGSGTLQFGVDYGVNIEAADGGILNTNNGIIDDTTIVVDSILPTLDDITDDAGGNPVSVGALVTYDVFFSEDIDVATVTAPDFGNAVTVGAATFTIDSVEEASPGVFRIELTTTGPGDIQLQINSGAVITDVVGNALDTGSAIPDDTTVTVTAPADPFAAWSGGAAFDEDTNGDGMDNGLAWVLGAADVNANANAFVPTVDSTLDPAYLIFTFRRADEATGDPNITIVAEYGTALTALDWTTAVHDNDDVIIAETDNHYSTTPGIDRVVVKLKRSTLGPGGKLFIRLRVVQAP